jgi:hypothetical protein
MSVLVEKLAEACDQFTWRRSLAVTMSNILEWLSWLPSRTPMTSARRSGESRN